MSKKQKSKMANQKSERRWSFPTLSLCPRCKSGDTVCRRTDTKKGIQYRQCRNAVCRIAYPQHGTDMSQKMSSKSKNLPNLEEFK